jgi:hypothetical protein
MKRLIAFGDSYTYGHGLEDCWVKDEFKNDTYTVGNVYSQYSWPSLVAKTLGYELVNNSEPGLSNLGMLHKLLNTMFTNNSVCVIMWSYPFRDMIFDKTYIPSMELMTKKIDHTNRITHIGSWVGGDLTNNWMMTHNNTDLVMRSWLHIHHANLYLASLNITHYNFFVDYHTLKAHKPAYIKIPFSDIDVQRCLDHALDGNHPGPLTQARIAKDITMLIKDL